MLSFNDQEESTGRRTIGDRIFTFYFGLAGLAFKKS